MKVYLSGPMSGLPEHNYPAFAKAAADLRALGIEVVSPHELDHLLAEGASWEDYMRNDLKALMDCTHLVLLPGWEDSRGAHLEVHLAHRLGITVRRLEDMLSNVKEPWVEERLAIPEGMALVPIEPTEAMIEAGKWQIQALNGLESAYKAMIAAAGVKP